MKEFIKVAVALSPFLAITFVPEIKADFDITVCLMAISGVLLFGWALRDMGASAFAFANDPDARKTSIHRFKNGNAMSVRDAKARGFEE